MRKPRSSTPAQTPPEGTTLPPVHQSARSRLNRRQSKLYQKCLGQRNAGVADFDGLKVIDDSYDIAHFEDTTVVQRHFERGELKNEVMITHKTSVWRNYIISFAIGLATIIYYFH
jgi:hypothetical protein